MKMVNIGNTIESRTITTSTELEPVNGRKSFYLKAIVYRTKGGWRFLRSYDTIHCGVAPDGSVHRFSDWKSNKTCEHLKSFLKDNYKGYWDLPIEGRRAIGLFM